MIDKFILTQKIAYDFYEKDLKEGKAPSTKYNWKRAERVVEYYTTKEDDEPYWRRGREEYPEFAHYFYE